MGCIHEGQPGRVDYNPCSALLTKHVRLDSAGTARMNYGGFSSADMVEVVHNDEIEQIAINNCKMAFETENKQLDYDLVLMGVLNLFKNDHFGFYLVAFS